MIIIIIEMDELRIMSYGNFDTKRPLIRYRFMVPKSHGNKGRV